MIGSMAMPEHFGYADVFLKGPPRHRKDDLFRLKHPAMDAGHRAKIFAPFDALAGFSDAVAAREVLYAFKRELSEGEKEELDRRFGILHRLTWNSRLARENRVPVTVTYYVPCRDQNSFSYGCRGQYVSVSGICRKVDMKSLQVDEKKIPLAEIIAIETGKTVDGRNIFEWETEAP